MSQYNNKFDAKSCITVKNFVRGYMNPFCLQLRREYSHWFLQAFNYDHDVCYTVEIPLKGESVTKRDIEIALDILILRGFEIDKKAYKYAISCADKM